MPDVMVSRLMQPSPPTVIIPPTGHLKFNPGHYLQTDGRGGAGLSEIQYLQTTGPGGNYPGSNVLGYQPYYSWPQLETAFNNYSGVTGGMVSDFNLQQQYCPGSRYVPTVIFFGRASDLIYVSNQSASVSGNAVPDYILGDSTYGNPGPGGAAGPNGFQYGYTVFGYEGASPPYWGGVFPCLWRPAVANRIIALYQAIANCSFVTTYGPYAGQTFTFDTHPLVELICDATEFNEDFISGPYTESDYSRAGFDSGYNACNNGAVAAFKNTEFAPFNCSDGLAPGGSAAIADLTQSIANQYANRGVCSNPDTFPLSSQMLWGQHLFKGDTTPDGGGSTWTNGGGFDYRTKMDYIASVQEADYGGQSPYATCVASIFSTAVTTFGASRILWCITYEPSGLGSVFFTDYVLPFINANPTISAPYPSNLP